MRRSGDIRWGELRLGIFIFVALALFLWASIQGGTSFFHKKYELRTQFGNVQGVVEGAAIWFQGVEVGKVEHLAFVQSGDSSAVTVRFTVDGSVWPLIHKDAKVRVQALNVFGEKFMEVGPGTHAAPRVAPGDTLASVEPPDLNEVMARAVGTAQKLDLFVGDLRTTLSEVRKGKGTVGRLLESEELSTRLNRTVEHIGLLADDLDDSQTGLRHSLVALAGTLDSLSRKIDRGEGTLGKLTRDPALFDALTSASTRADSVFGRMTQGRGNLGKLSQDEALYRNLEQSLGKLNELLADIQRNPHKYFKFSVF